MFRLNNASPGLIQAIKGFGASHHKDRSGTITFYDPVQAAVIKRLMEKNNYHDARLIVRDGYHLYKYFERDSIKGSLEFFEFAYPRFVLSDGHLQFNVNDFNDIVGHRGPCYLLYFEDLMGVYARQQFALINPEFRFVNIRDFTNYGRAASVIFFAQKDSLYADAETEEIVERLVALGIPFLVVVPSASFFRKEFISPYLDKLFRAYEEKVSEGLGRPYSIRSLSSHGISVLATVLMWPYWMFGRRNSDALVVKSIDDKVIRFWSLFHGFDGQPKIITCDNCSSLNKNGFYIGIARIEGDTDQKRILDNCLYIARRYDLPVILESEHDLVLRWGWRA